MGFSDCASHFCPFQWGAGRRGKVRWRGWDFNRRPKTLVSFYLPLEIKLIRPCLKQVAPISSLLTRDKSKSSLWTNPNLTPVTNPVGHPGQILRLPPLTNPNACGGQIGFVHRHKSEHSGRDHVRGGATRIRLEHMWTLYSHARAFLRKIFYLHTKIVLGVLLWWIPNGNFPFPSHPFSSEESKKKLKEAQQSLTV